MRKKESAAGKAQLEACACRFQSESPQGVGQTPDFARITIGVELAPEAGGIHIAHLARRVFEGVVAFAALRGLHPVKDEPPAQGGRPLEKFNPLGLDHKS